MRFCKEYWADTEETPALLSKYYTSEHEVERSCQTVQSPRLKSHVIFSVIFRLWKRLNKVIFALGLFLHSQPCEVCHSNANKEGEGFPNTPKTFSTCRTIMFINCFLLIPPLHYRCSRLIFKPDTLLWQFHYICFNDAFWWGKLKQNAYKYN